MALNRTKVHEYFKQLGIDTKATDVYLALLAHGPQNISDLSRNSGIERTHIYRLIDKLVEINLIEVEREFKRSIVKPAPITNLQILLSKKEQDLKYLQDKLGSIEQLLVNNTLSNEATRVQMYRGSAGLKQLFWNETKSTTENLSILCENMQSKTGLAFFERWVERCNDRRIHFRSIFGDGFIRSQDQWYEKHVNETLNHWEGRFLPSTIFNISHYMTVYDNVVAYYNWKDGEVFGVEIYNRQIADTQRYFFESLWQKSGSFDPVST